MIPFLIAETPQLPVVDTTLPGAVPVGDGVGFADILALFGDVTLAVPPDMGGSSQNVVVLTDDEEVAAGVETETPPPDDGPDHNVVVAAPPGQQPRAPSALQPVIMQTGHAALLVDRDVAGRAAAPPVITNAPHPPPRNQPDRPSDTAIPAASRPSSSPAASIFSEKSAPAPSPPAPVDTDRQIPLRQAVTQPVAVQKPLPDGVGPPIIAARPSFTRSAIDHLPRVDRWRDAPPPPLRAIDPPQLPVTHQPAIGQMNQAPDDMHKLPLKDTRLAMQIEGAPMAPVTEKGAVPQSLPPSTPVGGAETARQIAQQLVVAINGQSGRVTEISLNPEELGRVRMSMAASETAITLQVLADRPETTELMRRHIDTLAQEFRALGYDDIAFSFGDRGEADLRQGRDGHHETDDAAQDAPQNAQHRMTAPATGLDLRL